MDVSQEVVLKACLPNGDDTVKKVGFYLLIFYKTIISLSSVKLHGFFFQIQKAYDKCFGQDYSFDDLADTDGRDSDNDDLPDEYEGALLKIV